MVQDLWKTQEETSRKIPQEKRDPQDPAHPLVTKTANPLTLICGASGESSGEYGNSKVSAETEPQETCLQKIACPRQIGGHAIVNARSRGDLRGHAIVNAQSEPQETTEDNEYVITFLDYRAAFDPFSHKFLDEQCSHDQTSDETG